MRLHPRIDHRTVIVDFAVSRPEQVARAKRRGAIVSASAYYPVALADNYRVNDLAPARADPYGSNRAESPRSQRDRPCRCLRRIASPLDGDRRHPLSGWDKGHWNEPRIGASPARGAAVQRCNK
jgi:hypothetical protein